MESSIEMVKKELQEAKNHIAKLEQELEEEKFVHYSLLKDSVSELYKDPNGMIYYGVQLINKFEEEHGKLPEKVVDMVEYYNVTSTKVEDVTYEKLIKSHLIACAARKYMKTNNCTGNEAAAAIHALITKLKDCEG